MRRGKDHEVSSQHFSDEIQPYGEVSICLTFPSKGPCMKQVPYDYRSCLPLHLMQSAVAVKYYVYS